jgi:hypothetical protein
MSTTPLPTGSSAGIFSIAFRDARNGIVVGGDYRKEQAPTGTAALTGDAGASWTPVRGLGGFRSAVLFLTGPKNTVVAVGPSGADYSEDHGRTWRAIDGPGFHTIATAAGSDTAWAAGENGTVAQLRFDDRAATPGPR